MACDTRKSPDRRGPGLKFRRPTILTDNARCRAVMAVTDKIAAIASAPDPNAKLAQAKANERKVRHDEANREARTAVRNGRSPEKAQSNHVRLDWVWRHLTALAVTWPC